MSVSGSGGFYSSMNTVKLTLVLICFDWTVFFSLLKREKGQTKEDKQVPGISMPLFDIPLPLVA